MKNAFLRKGIIWLLLASLLLTLVGCFEDTVDPTDASATPTTQSGPTGDKPSEPSTQPTQPSTQPTEPPTQPTEPPTQPTEPPRPPETEPTQTEPRPSETKPTETEPKPTETKPVPPQADNPQGNKVIYLTFDDGPGIRTPELLAILEKYNVKATFFVVGTAYLEFLDDIANAGHSIGIHTNSHRYDEIYVSTEGFWQDFNAMDAKIFQHTGIHTKLYRFPGGSSNSVSKKLCPGIMTKLTREVLAKGYYYFDWNVDSNDAGGAKTAEEVFNNVISAVQNKSSSVVLMHDTKSYTVDAIERIIRWGLQNGYVFLPLDETSPEIHHTVRN